MLLSISVFDIVLKEFLPRDIVCKITRFVINVLITSHQTAAHGQISRLRVLAAGVAPSARAPRQCVKHLSKHRPVMIYTLASIPIAFTFLCNPIL